MSFDIFQLVNDTSYCNHLHIVTLTEKILVENNDRCLKSSLSKEWIFLRKMLVFLFFLETTKIEQKWDVREEKHTFLDSLEMPPSRRPSFPFINFRFNRYLYAMSFIMTLACSQVEIHCDR